jgi:hypothetical protein
MKKSSNSSYPLWKGLGVLTSEAGTPQAIWGARTNDKRTSLDVTTKHGDVVTYAPADITVEDRTARIEFVSGDTIYRIREPREADGSWLSVMKTDLPVEALRAFANQGENMNPEETLDAFALPDSAYIVGLVYSNATGQWSRVDGDWILLSPGDTTFEGMEVITIDPERAQAYIGLYDKHFVTVTNTEQYESANPQA